MTAEGYKTFINGSVMASFMEGIAVSYTHLLKVNKTVMDRRKIRKKQ